MVKTSLFTSAHRCALSPAILKRRGLRYFSTISLDLAFYKERIPFESRTDRNLLQRLVPDVIQDIEEVIQAGFSIKNKNYTVSNMKPVYSYELSNGTIVTAAVFDSRVEIKAYCRNITDREKIRIILNDFKLSANYETDVQGFETILAGAKRAGRARLVKVLSEVVDPRFIPTLQIAVSEDKSAKVRFFALRALGILRREGYQVSVRVLKKALSDPSEDVKILAAAILSGNRFEADEKTFYQRPMSGSLPEEKVFGAIMGGVVGDVIGYPVEFRTREEIISLYGGPIDGPVLSKSRTVDFGQYSDDSEMLFMMAMAMRGSKGFSPDLFAECLAEHIFNMDTGTVPNHSYGINTLRAGRRLYSGVDWHESGLNFSTCSPSIRAAPLGLLFFDDEVMLEKAIIDASMITHNNSTAIGGALAVSLMVAKLLVYQGDYKFSPLIKWIAGKVRGNDAILAKNIVLASRLTKERGMTDEKASQILGTSSETRQTVPWAFYAFLKSPRDYRETILRAANAGGDADSTASIAGSFSGALNGLSAIPKSWLRVVVNSYLFNRACKNISAAISAS